MFTTILSALAAIPELLKAVRELLAWFEKAEQNDWFKKSDEAYKNIDHANSTDEEKDAAAKAIADLIHKS